MTIDEAGKWLATIKHPFAGEVTKKLRELEADLLRAIHDSEVAHEYASMVIGERARLVEVLKVGRNMLSDKWYDCSIDFYHAVNKCADIEPEGKT